MAILFPRPFAFAVDDLGWNEGSDLSQEIMQGPYRTGVKRYFDLRDYQYLVEVGKKVGVRIQCLFILSEMDRQNILAKFPTTTYLRDKWNNTHHVNDGQVEIMNYVKDQSAYMEFGLHGTGHEYWASGEKQKRAEWYNLEDKKPWPEQSLRDHLFCFKEIMAQYGFTRENGHSFPESFVPCAYSYYWNPFGDYSLGKLLAEAGVKFANTDFSRIQELKPPSEKNDGDFDQGVHVINRVNYGNRWDEFDSLPKTLLTDQETDIIESHWPNWLAPDHSLQKEVTERWIAYYKSVQKMPDRYIAKNTEQLHSQWLYKKFTTILDNVPGSVDIDNTLMPTTAYDSGAVKNMVLKIKLENGKHVSSAFLNEKPIAGCMESSGFAFLYLPPLEQEKYTLHYSVGENEMDDYVLNDGTYNVYELSKEKDQISIQLRMYGTQLVKVKCSNPKSIFLEGKQLRLGAFNYNQEASLLSIEISAIDMQGSTGVIKLIF